MRIPSSLTDDNLYRRHGRPAVSRQPHRRLFRLFLAFVLVIAVMRQAGNPRIYEVFFSPPPAALDTAVVDRATGAAAVRDAPARAITRVTSNSPAGTVAIAQLGSSEQDGGSERVGSSEQGDVAGQTGDAGDVIAGEMLGAVARTQEPLTRTVAGLDEATAVQLIAYLAEMRAAGNIDDPMPLPRDLVDALNAAARAGGEPLLSAAEAARAQRPPTEPDASATEPTAPTPTEPDASATDSPALIRDRVDDEPSDDTLPVTIDWSDPLTLQRLQEALDLWAVDRVDPGSIWKATDSLAFYRLLEEPTALWLRRQPASQPSVISMLQQPEVYLRRRVAIPGTVARAIHRQAADNPSGIEEYWELWIRPRDGSEQPLVFFTAAVPPEIAEVGAEVSLAEGPMVWVHGLYLKRLAYRSASGRQLAPAVVGSLHPIQSVSVADVAAAPPIDQPRGWMIVGISALLGIGLALLIFYQTFRGPGSGLDRRRWSNPSTPGFLGSLSNRSDNQSGTDQ